MKTIKQLQQEMVKPVSEPTAMSHKNAYDKHYKLYQKLKPFDDKLAEYHLDTANHHAKEFHRIVGKKLWNPAENKDSEHVTIGESIHPETYLDNPHIERLNDILDQLTGKYFINLQVFVDAVRAALDFHGFKLPHLDCEQETHGPSQPRAYGDIIHGPGFEDNRNVPGIPTEFEYILQIKYDTMSEAGYPFPLYLYMCANRVDQDGDNDSKELYWETYAQIVTKDELADLADMADDRKFPEPIGDASGETEYLRKQRHTNTTGTSPEDDIE